MSKRFSQRLFSFFFVSCFFFRFWFFFGFVFLSSLCLGGVCGAVQQQYYISFPCFVTIQFFHRNDMSTASTPQRGTKRADLLRHCRHILDKFEFDVSVKDWKLSIEDWDDFFYQVAALEYYGYPSNNLKVVNDMCPFGIDHYKAELKEFTDAQLTSAVQQVNAFIDKATAPATPAKSKSSPSASPAKDLTYNEFVARRFDVSPTEEIQESEMRFYIPPQANRVHITDMDCSEIPDSKKGKCRAIAIHPNIRRPDSEVTWFWEKVFSNACTKCLAKLKRLELKTTFFAKREVLSVVEEEEEADDMTDDTESASGAGSSVSGSVSRASKTGSSRTGSTATTATTTRSTPKKPPSS